MTPPVLILDCDYLAYRNFHAMPSLSFEGVRTGVVFGFLRDVLALQDLHCTSRVVFAWDFGRPLRKRLCPTYKEGRLDRLTDQEKELHEEMRRQRRHLRSRHLKDIGFRNVFYQKGYEADDIIASLCQTLKGERIIIVSSDKDLYQLLDEDVSIWNPHKGKMTTQSSFFQEWRVGPKSWAIVKAMAGCGTDNVPGIAGVGEKTAIKYLLGEMNLKSKTYQKIISNLHIKDQNFPLVSLPFNGTKEFELREDQVTREKWNRVAAKFGIQSLDIQGVP